MKSSSFFDHIGQSRIQIVNYPNQPRDPDGQFAGGSGADSGDNVGADRFGNSREDGRWFDQDGIYMTDGYVDKHGLPVTHSGFGDDRSGRYSVVLSERGDLHVMRERSGGPGDALYSRHGEDVRIQGIDAEGARSLSTDLRSTIDATTTGRPTTEAGEDAGGESFGTGQVRVSGATGVTLTSAPNGAVVVSGLGRNGADVKLDQGDAAQFADSLDSIAGAAGELSAGTYRNRSAIQFFAHLKRSRTQQIGASMARSVAPERDVTGRSWFRITNKAADTAEVYLYDEIGDWGVSAGDFAKELGEVTATNIDLRLNTPGGAVFDGLAIFNALQRHPATITVHVDGLAASIASVIAMAGDRIVIDRYAQMMIHEAHAIACGSTKDMSAMAKLLDEYSDNIAAIYSQRAGGTTTAWRERMRSETWFSAKEAVSAGLADAIAEGTAKGRPGNTWDLSIFNYAGRAGAPDPFAAGGIVPAPTTVVVDSAETIIPARVYVGETVTEQYVVPGDGVTVTAILPPPVEETVVAPVDFDPQLFRESMHAAAFDAPAPPPVPARPIDLGPAPPPPEPATEPPPIGLTDIFAAAMTLAANDAPAPPTNSPPTNPADEPGFLMNAQAFRAAIKEAVSE